MRIDQPPAARSKLFGYNANSWTRERYLNGGQGHRRMEADGRTGNKYTCQEPTDAEPYADVDKMQPTTRGNSTKDSVGLENASPPQQPTHTYRVLQESSDRRVSD